MKLKGDTRVVSLTLNAGRKYRFRYLQEGGHWLTDPNAHGVERNNFGDEDSVIDLTDINHLPADDEGGTRED